MAVGEAVAVANLAVAEAWLEARTTGDRERVVSLTRPDVAFWRTGESRYRGDEGIEEALRDGADSGSVLVIVPDGPFATATISGRRGFETWRLRVVDGLVSEIVLDPDPFD